MIVLTTIGNENEPYLKGDIKVEIYEDDEITAEEIKNRCAKDPTLCVNTDLPKLTQKELKEHGTWHYSACWVNGKIYSCPKEAMDSTGIDRGSFLSFIKSSHYMYSKKYGKTYWMFYLHSITNADAFNYYDCGTCRPQFWY